MEYNPDPDFHSGIKRDSEVAKSTAAAKKKGGASRAVPTPIEPSEPQSPPRSNGDVDTSSRQSPAPTIDNDRAISPVSSASSADEPPLAQRIKLNGHARPSTPPRLPPTSSPGAISKSPAVPVTPKPSSVARSDGSPMKGTPVKTEGSPLNPTTVWVCESHLPSDPICLTFCLCLVAPAPAVAYKSQGSHDGKIPG